MVLSGKFSNCSFQKLIVVMSFTQEVERRAAFGGINIFSIKECAFLANSKDGTLIKDKVALGKNSA